jgi:hypothetical protein
MRRQWLLALGIGLLAWGCGRYFPGPIQPLPKTEQQAHMIV